jgi:hypothetical protein
MATQEYSGPARAAWILLFLTCGISIVPFLGFGAWLIAAPVLLTTFILSIIVLSRGGTAEGLVLLLATIVGAPLVIAIAPLISSFAASSLSHQYVASSTPAPTQPSSESALTSSSSQHYAESLPVPTAEPVIHYAVATATPVPRDPEAVTLTKPVSITVQYGVVGIPAGSKLRFISRAGDKVRVRYSDGIDYDIPISATDLQ